MIECHLDGHSHYLARDTLVHEIADTYEHIKDHQPLQRSRDGRVLCPWMTGAGQFCGESLKGEKGLAKHVATVHYGLFRLQCDACKKPFSRKDSLERHHDERRCQGTVV